MSMYIYSYYQGSRILLFMLNLFSHVQFALQHTLTWLHIIKLHGTCISYFTRSYMLYVYNVTNLVWVVIFCSRRGTLGLPFLFSMVRTQDVRRPSCCCRFSSDGVAFQQVPRAIFSFFFNVSSGGWFLQVLCMFGACARRCCGISRDGPEGEVGRSQCLCRLASHSNRIITQDVFFNMLTAL